MSDLPSPETVRALIILYQDKVDALQAYQEDLLRYGGGHPMRPSAVAKLRAYDAADDAFNGAMREAAGA